MSELTPWFPFSTPPVRPGVYNVSCRGGNQSGKWYARFDGERWSFWENVRQGVSHKRAQFHASRAEFLYYTPSGTWRGLSSDPSKEK